jgi:hypothetical protein
MRTINLKTSPRVQGIVSYLIDRLEDAALDCCLDAPEWTKCLSPIVDAWHKLQESWERLIDIPDERIRMGLLGLGEF